MNQSSHRSRHRFLELLRHHTPGVRPSWLPLHRAFTILSALEPSPSSLQDTALLARFSERRDAFDALQRSAALPFTCPACGFPALHERAAYEVCGLCGWEDDGQDTLDASAVRGGRGGKVSLHDARLSYARLLKRQRILTPDTGGHRSPQTSAAQEARSYVDQLANGIAPGAASLLKKAAAIR